MPLRRGPTGSRQYRRGVSRSPAQLIGEVSRFLDSRWDPIGVYGVDDDWPPGEYEQYATHVVGMLQGGETAASISHYLTQQATGSMGVGPGPARAVAQRLHEWWNLELGDAPLNG